MPYSYVPITDPELLPDQPIPSLLAFRWRDNPLAMFEGAAGAPRLQAAAHVGHAVGSQGLDRITVWGIPAIVAGSAGGGGGTSYIYLHTFTAMKGGSLRMFCDMRASAASQTARIAVIKNGSVVSELTGNSTSYLTKTIDFSFVGGDQIVFRGGLNYTDAGGVAYFNDLIVTSALHGTYRT